ncbi:MAG: hypothetical protein CMH52_14260 [Myxococcales bacterium]|nr:hypothetical protein [Myxococcales bacterium]
MLPLVRINLKTTVLCALIVFFTGCNESSTNTPDGMPMMPPADPCDGQADGTVISTGATDECAYDSVCSESGVKSRQDQICVGGVTTEMAVTEACNRETDDIILSEGEFGSCDYADPCAELAIQTRTDRVCENGAATDRVVSADCERETDGLVLSEGAFDACDYADPCAESAIQTRTDRVCEDGAATVRAVSADCQRETDGLVLSEGAFDACDYAGPCAESATQTRTDRVCENGASTDRVVSADCQRETDGVVLAGGVFGACVFADECTETGTQLRTDRVCSEGVATDIEVSGQCTRETDGIVLAEGPFGACAYGDDCIETGTQVRTDRVCVDGVATDTDISGACTRETDGIVLNEGDFAECAFADDCIETGTHLRTDRVCSEGIATDIEVSGQCTRETDGIVLAEGDFGPCAFAHDCIETGTHLRTDRVCSEGVVTDIEVSAQCTRETDGIVLVEGDFGPCAFADDCIETGTHLRTDRVCSEGVAIDTDVSDQCTRETDGVVLAEGDFGACAFADDCIETGTQLRTDRVCTDGVATDTEVSDQCSRETDGVVLAEGDFGACVFGDDCIETGTHLRTDRVCVDGVATDTEISAVCARETDGVVLSAGVFGPCEYESQCDVQGTKARNETVCQQGTETLSVVNSGAGCERPELRGSVQCGLECVDVSSNVFHCGACDGACGQNSECDGGQCRCQGNRTGPECNSCLPNFAGDDCERCAERFAGPQCDECIAGFAGVNCDEIPQLDYEMYTRQAGVEFTPIPAPMPLPDARCADKPNQIVFDGIQADVNCLIPDDTCARLTNGAQLVCAGGMTVSGIVWMTSTTTDVNTLLVADYVEVMGTGEFHLTGDSQDDPFAQRAEIFLRHEYCGKPEDGFDADFEAASSDECVRKGKFMSMAGQVKIAGQPKTTWSLLTRDSRDTHAIEANLIVVDDCAGWMPGDALSIAPTGGDQETYQGVHNWCNGEGCIAKENSKTEQRQIERVSDNGDGTCDVILTDALAMNHRGNPVGVASPMLRIQAEVVNQSRSVMITGGYQTDLQAPNTRVATRYDYSNAGTPTHTYGPNTDQAPCRVCKQPDDPSAGQHELCTDETACQVYDAEGESVQLCGRDCSPIGMQGITTVQMHGGVMQVSHAAVEKCGRRELAEYCLHFHHVGDVKDMVRTGEASHESYFVGNAVKEGINKGITIHGTHNALVQNNVIADQKGPGIYIEDGNELFNVVEENVVLCTEVQSNNLLCKLKNAANRPETTDSDWNEVSGIYFLAAMNHTIGNRVFGYDNAMYVNRNTSGQTGLGMARGKLCTSASPFGYTVGNVFHNNAGFGWYANTAFPMDLVNLGGIELTTTADNMMGTVTDWTKCLPFSLTGEDHSSNIKIQRHTEYFNDFSAGVYSVGDVTLENYTSYGGNKGLYWKTYRRGLNSDPLCVNCVFARTSIEGPGGSALVEFQDSDFYRRHEAYQVNHHCSLDGGTGGLCASHYDFRSSRFYEWSQADGDYVAGGPFFYSGVYPTTTLIYTPDNQVLTHVTQNVAFDIDGEPRCQDSTPYAGEGWYGCDNTGLDDEGDALELRIVRIYSPDRGQLTVTNHSEGGLDYVIPWTNYGPQSGGASAYGVLPNCQGDNCPNYMRVSGYVFSVPANADISLSFATVLAENDVLSDLFALEYSDAQMRPQTSLTIRAVTGTGLMDSDQPCTFRSDHGRAFITPFGPIHGAAGAWYNECGHGWPLKYTMQDLIDRSYQGDDAGNHGGGNHNGGDNGGDQPEVDLTAEPPTPSPWSQRAHPEPERVISLYTSIPGHADSFSNDGTCRGQSNCSWPTWGSQEGVCESCNITWFPGWSPQRSFVFDYQLADDAGQLPSDRILKVELEPNWYSLFEFPPTETLDLTDYDVLHFEVWSPGVTNLGVKARDYGPNGVWDAALDDIERTKFVAFDDNLIPNQWSVIEINLDELFAPDAPRNLGQMLIVDVGPNLAGMPMYFSNLYFYRRQ